MGRGMRVVCNLKPETLNPSGGVPAMRVLAVSGGKKASAPSSFRSEPFELRT